MCSDKKCKKKKNLHWSKDKKAVTTSYEFSIPLSGQNAECFVKQ